MIKPTFTSAEAQKEYPQIYQEAYQEAERGQANPARSELYARQYVVLYSAGIKIASQAGLRKTEELAACGKMKAESFFEGYDQGYSEGYDQGYSEGYYEGQRAGYAQKAEEPDYCKWISVYLVGAAILAGIGAIAGEYMTPGMNAAQGAALLGFTGLSTPFIFFVPFMIFRGIAKSFDDKGKPLSSEASFNIVAFIAIGSFFASLAIASYIGPELGLKATPFDAVFTAGGAPLGIAIGLILVAGGCAVYCKNR